MKSRGSPTKTNSSGNLKIPKSSSNKSLVEEEVQPPFVPLEETTTTTSSSSVNNGNNNNDDIQNIDDDDDAIKKSAGSIYYGKKTTPSPSSGPIAQIVIKHAPFMANLDGKKIISTIIFTLLFLLICDSFFSEPENRIIKPNFSQKFLSWVQDHPLQGLIWILIVMSIAVVFMIPIGTPLTLGCGYIYKGAYGWKIGVLIATVVSMMGSALGAVTCFLLGRYLMRDTVRKWIRKYPLFDAIDIASAEHGLRIMAMLYLTPILPLGPVSYMCGTTSMLLSHFIMAKVAALPLMMLYVFIGASTGTLIDSKHEVENIEGNESMIIAGIILSIISIAVITHYIKQELNKILERQKKQLDQPDNDNVDEEATNVEMTKVGNIPRQRKH